MEAAAERLRLSALPAIGIATCVIDCAEMPRESGSTPLASFPKTHIYELVKSRSSSDEDA
jgi:hypothetical protein